MRILRPVVQAFMRAVLDGWHDLAFGSPIGAQLISDHALRRQTLLLQKSRQQALGSLAVAVRLDDLVEHIALLVNRSPQPDVPTVDAHEKLIEMVSWA